MVNIVLVEPEIPFNTGAIIRSCALTKCRLHLIKPLGFSLDEKNVKKAGLDYMELVDVKTYDSFLELVEANTDSKFFYATTKGSQYYSDVTYTDGDFIVFGKESQGLSRDILNMDPNSHIKIPIDANSSRSLNLSNAVNIVIYESLRQQGFPGLE